MSLYRLERMKIRLSTYGWAILGIFASLLAMGILCLFLGVSGPEISVQIKGVKEDEDMIFTSWNGLSALSTALHVACFGIFSAVFAAKIIVDEYCGKRAVLLFTYPVSRRKILHVKCLFVLCLTTFSAFVSNAAVMGSLYIAGRIFGINPEPAGGHFVISVLLASLMSGILSSEIGVIAAVVGWKKRSVMTTIVCSLVIVCFVPNLIASLPGGIVWVMLVMGVLFGVAAGLMHRVLVDGIEKMEV